MRCRLTLAQRKHRARLARERQGPDGKWETNAKKREAWMAKKSCLKLGRVCDALKAKREADEAAAPEIAKKFVAELEAVTEKAQLRALLPRLEGVLVTEAVQQQSPSIADALSSAAKRCRKSKDVTVVRLLTRWRLPLRQQVRAAAAHVSKRIRQKCSPPAAQEDPAKATAPAEAQRNTGSVVVRAPPPASSVWDRRKNLKLGSLFNSMRAKRAAEEAATLEAAPEIVAELEAASDWPALKALLPRLEPLSMTKSVARQAPSLYRSFQAAAKRCRKSKDDNVAGLLSSWREVYIASRGSRRSVAEEQPADVPQCRKRAVPDEDMKAGCSSSTTSTSKRVCTSSAEGAGSCVDATVADVHNLLNKAKKRNKLQEGVSYMESIARRGGLLKGRRLIESVWKAAVKDFPEVLPGADKDDECICIAVKPVGEGPAAAAPPRPKGKPPKQQKLTGFFGGSLVAPVGA